MNEWQWAASSEWFLLHQVLRRFAQANFKDPDKLLPPMPWDPPPKRHGDQVVDPSQLRQILAAHRALPAAVQEGTTVTT